MCIRDSLEHDAVKEIADKHGKTPAQVLVRWALQHNVVSIPKSVTAERIRSNAEVFDFELDTKDMDTINGMNENARYGLHPDEFDYASTTK